MSRSFLCRCGGATSVIDSRESVAGKGIRRRRMCNDCKLRVTTYEIAMDHAPQFVEMVDSIGVKSAILADSMAELTADVQRIQKMCATLRELDESRYGGAAANRQKQKESAV